MKTRVSTRAHVRVRLSVLLNEALDRAVGVACWRAFKHRSDPVSGAEEMIPLLEQHLANAFWGALDELGVEIDG